MCGIKVAFNTSFVLAIAALLVSPAVIPLADAQWTTGGQFVNTPGTQGIMPGSPGSYTQQPAGLLPPRGPYACPFGYYLDPVTRQCMPVPPGYPGMPQPLPYNPPYDPRVA